MHVLITITFQLNKKIKLLLAQKFKIVKIKLDSSVLNKLR